MILPMRIQECARVVIVSPGFRVLLMKTRTWEGDLWVTPGGRMEAGEEARAAALRELREETGLADVDLGAEIWIREWTFQRQDGQLAPQREHFFLLRCEEFVPTVSGMGRQELDVHREFRWWAVPELTSSTESFAPPRIANLLREMQRFGLPATPVLVAG
ncbi:MAG: NUDIX domain-containing protein [Rubrivivax sp.]